MNTSEITKEDLLEYGMEEIDEEIPAYPFQKHLIKEDEKPILSICLSVVRNKAEFCLMLPSGSIIYLQVDNLEELEIFEKCIAGYEF